ncbi:MAG: glycosyltransferase [Gemmataceae bacterium]|nr:glycosyltransferase [Gemmataceae bacterium]
MPPLRVLFLATYFPKPLNPAMGVWALREAEQLTAAGADVRVVSCTSWVPRWVGRAGKAVAWAMCPPAHDWGAIHVDYPRWPVYMTGWLKEQWRRHPGRMISIGWPFVARRLRNIVRDWRPDVVYAHHGGMSGELARRLNAELSLPFIVKDHDFDEVADARALPDRRRLYAAVCQAAAAMAPVARRMGQELSDLYPGTNVIVCHNGVAPPAPELLGVPRPSELDGKTVVCTAGIFYERKAIPLLIRAFTRVATGRPDLVLRIVGDGPDRANVEAAVSASPVRDRITMLGLRPQAEVFRELVWCDLFALVGWDEPFATVYLEACAAGRPMIWANDGGINDVLCHETHGLTVPPRDEEAVVAAMERLVTDSELRKRCGVNSRRLFDERLNAQATARKLLRLLAKAARREPVIDES